MDVALRLAASQEPWTRYSAMKYLIGMPDSDPDLAAAKDAMLIHPLVSGLMTDLKDWPGEVLSSHKSAKQPFHKLAFLADIGVMQDDSNMPFILGKVMEHVSAEGLVQLPTCIPEHYGGTGERTWAWAACDAPVLLYSLAKMGRWSDPQVRKGVDYLLGIVRENGWGCSVSKELGSFRGPSRKEDPCPYVNLYMLRLLSLFEEHIDGPEALTAINCLLDLWERSLVAHPYIFYMGTDFRKLKAPFIWYDILHLTEALSHYPAALDDARFSDMLGQINSKSVGEGAFIPESVWQAWKGWDFGQSKIPSSWLGLLIARINMRVADHAARRKN